MPLPIINGKTWATWNGQIFPPRRPTITFDSPVLRGTGMTVLPERSPESTVITETYVALRSDADALIAGCYALNGYLISVTDDEGVSYSNVAVKDVVCTKPRKVIGETTDGTAGLVYRVVANWTLIAALPENAT